MRSRVKPAGTGWRQTCNPATRPCGVCPPAARADSLRQSLGQTTGHGSDADSGFRRHHHRRGHVGPVPALPVARTGLARAGVRGRHRCRRHLVLEPLSRRALQFGELFLRLLVFEGACWRNGTGRSILPASRKRCAISTMSPTSSTCAAISSFAAGSRRRFTRRRREAGAITLEDGSRFSARFLITAIGPLSTPTLPRIEGRDDFKGASFHTARWPKEPVDFTGKRVAVIGTGATGVQTIQTIAGQVGHLTVFQRTPNWCAPLHNGKIDAETQAKIKAGYPEMFARCQETFACFLHTPDPRGAFEVSDEEREANYERLYGERGFGIWQGNFSDILIDRKANATISDFVARKIRAAGEEPGGGREADPEESRLRHPPAAARDLLLRGLQPGQCRAGRHQGDADRADHARGHQDQRARNTSSTSSSTRPASTPSPAVSTRSISAAPAARG